jgi:hypothetical protein
LDAIKRREQYRGQAGDSINITGITDSVTSARSEAYAYAASNRLQEGDGI